MGLNLPDMFNSANLLPDEFFDEMDLRNKRDIQQYEAEQAAIESEKHLQKLKDTVTQLQNELDTERQERAKADEEAMKYTKKVDRRNLWIAIIGVLGTLFSIFTYFFS